MKTLFRKYLALNIGLVLVSFSLFGCIFMWQTYKLALRNGRSELESSTENVALMAQMVLEYKNSSPIKHLFLLSLDQVTQDGGTVIACDASGNAWFVVDAEGYREDPEVHVPQEAIEVLISEHDFFAVGNLGGVFSAAQYTCGAQVVSGTGMMIGAVFVSSPAIGFLETMAETQQNFILISAIVMLLAIVAAYILAENMSKPLRVMIEATRKYGEGDFSAKVPEGRGDEIGELAHSINQMSGSLNKLEQMRSTFISNVSHELKTPMTSITGFIDGILDGTIPQEREREYLERISSETRRLSRLVTRMLQASRIQSGAMRIHPMRFDFCETVSQTILSFEQILKEKHVDVRVEFEEEDMHVIADQDSIVQVVYNLIDNATKFVPDKGTFAVTILREGTKLVTTIANTGPVIPPEKLPNIFDRFYKADPSRAKDKNGAGLGLFIVKSVLTMHGEDITVSSENDLTKFRFTLPYVD